MDRTRLHPQALAALGVQRRSPLTRAGLAEVRRSMIDATPAEVGPGPDLPHVADFEVDGVPVRLFAPGVASGPTTSGPAIVYAHGGGWVMGGLETHDGFCRLLAATTGWSVLAVDYRLAPEHPHPAALEDVERGVAWARRAGFGPLAVAGDSAGGHLATVAARRARDNGTPLAAQILICPVVDPAMTYPDLDDYGLHSEEMRFFWDAYAPPGTDRDHPDLNPFNADPAGLPSTMVITAELDVLGEEGERYAQRLMAAGVPVVSTRYQGLIHNFPRKLALFDAAVVAIAQVAAFLPETFP